MHGSPDLDIDAWIDHRSLNAQSILPEAAGQDRRARAADRASR